MKFVIRFHNTNGASSEEHYATEQERWASLNQFLEDHRRCGHFVFGNETRVTITDCRGVQMMAVDIPKTKRARQTPAFAKLQGSTTLCSAVKPGLAAITEEQP